MMETYSSETLVDFQRTTLCYIPEDRAVHNHCCENLKSYKLNTIRCKIESIFIRYVRISTERLLESVRQWIGLFILTKQLEDWWKDFREI
jgi:hypothetical protein